MEIDGLIWLNTIPWLGKKNPGRGGGGAAVPRIDKSVVVVVVGGTSHLPGCDVESNFCQEASIGSFVTEVRLLLLVVIRSSAALWAGRAPWDPPITPGLVLGIADVILQVLCTSPWHEQR